MLCAEITSEGFVHVVYPQPADVSTCPAVVALASEIGTSPFALTTEQGGQVGAAILGVWGTAYVLRLIARVITEKGSTDE